MAIINFPSAPADGDVFTAGDHTWVFSAVGAGGPGAWNLQTQTVTGPTGPTGATLQLQRELQEPQDLRAQQVQLAP
jgi:hypothetical protein